MLSDDDAAILEFEKGAPSGSGRKEDAIRARFGYSPTRYYQRLNRIMDDPLALEMEPQLIHLLQRRRSQRMAARSGRRFDSVE